MSHVTAHVTNFLCNKTRIPEIKKSICTIRPISRSYFKLIEIVQCHDLNDTVEPIKTFHLAEGPGGFIEATAFLRKNPQDIYYGMTLINETNINIPGWKKADFLMKKHKNI